MTRLMLARPPAGAGRGEGGRSREPALTRGSGRRTIVAIILLALTALPAPAQKPEQKPEPACPFPGQRPMLVVQMFFGQSTRGAGPISRRAWQRFVADTITPALPAGFTISAGAGQWRDPVTAAIGREPAEILLVAAPDTPDLRRRIAGIADAFRHRFDQRAVGIVSSNGCAAF